MTVADALKAEEGWRPHVYPDSLGWATIGYGFLVDSRRGEGLPKEVAEYWLSYLVDEIRGELVGKWPPFLSQPADVRDALVLMSYQLGVDGVLGFKNMLSALEAGDRQGAAEHALESKWHEQTPERAQRVASIIRGSDGNT